MYSNGGHQVRIKVVARQPELQDPSDLQLEKYT